MATSEIIIAGFGGQGILSAGKLLAEAGLIEDKNVSWFPSYGPEMRGGTANCNIVVSDQPVGSPIINKPNVLIAMNEPSLDKFVDTVVDGGVVIVDSSLINKTVDNPNIKFFAIPATSIATEMGNQAYATIILLGRLIKETNVVSTDNFEAALRAVLPERRHHMIPDNMVALAKGME